MKKEVEEIHISDYNYPLDDAHIAKFPLQKRDESKLLFYDHGELSTRVFKELPDVLPAESMLVYNNTRVIQARMLFHKETGAQIEIFCLEPCEPHDYVLAFQQTERCVWTCLIGNLKKWKEGVLYRDVTVGDHTVRLTAERLSGSGANHKVEFRWDDPSLTFAELLDAAGILPIPPYLHRETEKSDEVTYQTVYSKVKGSVAAPTAGLHFTPEVLEELDRRGFYREEVTLHVGAGTFRPVKSETIGEHEMHTEYISVNRSAIENLIKHLGHIVAVGTTSVRTLESLYYIGLMLEKDPDAEDLTVGQWVPYEDEEPTLSVEAALQNIIRYLDRHQQDHLVTATQIIIAPGYQFRLVNGMITNFHQPQSTLLLLVSAFVHGDWRRIYDYALANDYRFLSYGDSSLLLP